MRRRCQRPPSGRDAGRDPDGLVAGGRRFTLYQSGGFVASPLITAAGLTAGVSNYPGQAAYLQTRLRHRLRVISATVMFSGKHPGTLGLVNWSKDNNRIRTAGGTSPFASIHFSMTLSEWILGTFHDSQVQTIRAATQSLDPAVPHTVTLTRVGDEVTVDVDGAETTASSPALARAETGWACWELYAYRKGDQPPTIRRIAVG